MRRSAASARAEKFMVETCQIVRPSKTPNGRGGWTNGNAGTTIYSGKCAVAVDNVRPYELATGGRGSGRTDMTIYVPRGTDVRLEDVVTWDGADWEVIGYQHEGTFAATFALSVRRTQR